MSDIQNETSDMSDVSDGFWVTLGPVGLGQYNSLGEYCGPNTASSVFLILLSIMNAVSGGTWAPESEGAHSIYISKSLHFPWGFSVQRQLALPYLWPQATVSDLKKLILSHKESERKTSWNAVSLKGSKLPKLSRIVYVVVVILFYMLEIKRMSGQSL